MNRFGVNTIANIAAKLWSLVSIYIFIPAYIQILGETSYGLVSFFATLQSALNILGLGLANTLRREFAVGNDEESANQKYLLMRSVENIYYVLGVVIIAICAFGASFIAERWLNIETLDAKMVSTVISLMGVSIALQLVANLYAGCLFGMERQVLANGYTIAWSAIKSCGALAIIAFVSADLVMFYTWHIISDIVYLLVLRLTVVKKLPRTAANKWHFRDFSNLKSIWRYTTGLLVVSMIALVNRQLDKVIISNFLTLTELGAYNLTNTLGSLASIIPIAVYTSIFPKFTKYATSHNLGNLKEEFIKVNRLVNLILCSMGAFIAVYALPLIQVWTGTNSYEGILGRVGTLVVLAVAIIEFQQIPYALALAFGNTSINAKVGLVFMPVVACTSWYGISRFGLPGAGAVFLTMMILQTVLYLILVYKKYLPDCMGSVLIYDTLLPLILSLVLAYASQILVGSGINNVWLVVLWAVVCGAVTLLLLLLLFARKEFQNTIAKVIRK